MNINEIIQSIKVLPFGSDKQIMIENLFHISFWNKMNTENKLELFQLLEDNLSYTEGRNPSQIIAMLKRPHLATTNVQDNKIKISIYHLENGFGYLREMNAQMFCAIIHEHEHMSQYLASQGLIIDANAQEYSNNYDCLIPYSEEINGYTFHRFQATEYYAYQISEDRTKKVFKRLEETFGADLGYFDWREITEKAVPERLIEYYNEHNHTNYTVKELYDYTQKIIAEESDVIEEMIK